MRDSREPHYAIVKRILCYLQGTLDYSLCLRHTDLSTLVAYSYADWAGCPDMRRLPLGMRCSLVILSFLGPRNDSLLSLVPVLRLKYQGIANVVAETTWLRQLLQELHLPVHRVTIVYCDNVCTMYLSMNLVQH